jgi:gamma-glutamyl hercynylcysteine S-oxide synthase
LRWLELKIEGSNDLGVDVQYRWKESSRRFHSHSLHIHSFDIDKYPITNVEFKRFMDAAHYHPKDNLNFLRDREPFRRGWENRQPREWEWQYAAQRFRCPTSHGICEIQIR